jgi:hypothetical protein
MIDSAQTELLNDNWAPNIREDISKKICVICVICGYVQSAEAETALALGRTLVLFARTGSVSTLIAEPA